MNSKEAKQTAAARGFSSVREWMKENRSAAANFRSRMTANKAEKPRLSGLLSALDLEYKTFSPFV